MTLPIQRTHPSFRRAAVSDAHPFARSPFRAFTPNEMLRRARDFHAEMDRRRTTRHFSDAPVPRELIEFAIRTAGTAPSGAHQQPWTLVVVSDPEIKRRMREAAEEEEERVNYSGRMPPEWLSALAPLGTETTKAHITTAPYVVVVFRQTYGLKADGSRRTHYHTTESCGSAAELFIAAMHRMGVVTLTHTPSPMGSLGEMLGRPENENGVPADARRLSRRRDARPRPAAQVAGRYRRVVRRGLRYAALRLALVAGWNFRR